MGWRRAEDPLFLELWVLQRRSMLMAKKRSREQESSLQRLKDQLVLAKAGNNTKLVTMLKKIITRIEHPKIKF